MDKFLEFIVDTVFSFGMFMFLSFVGFVYVVLVVADSENRHRETTRAATEACYSQGMVLVTTDAGQRCADPRTLVKVK